MHSLELYHSPIKRQSLFSFPLRWCGALWLSWWIYCGKGDASRLLILRHKRCIFHLAPFHSVLVLRIQPPCCKQGLDIWRGHLQVFWLIVPTKVLLSSQNQSPEGWMTELGDNSCPQISSCPPWHHVDQRGTILTESHPNCRFEDKINLLVLNH